ncbi:MAG: substrate-binding domain-containing protein [Solirubrobacteraceae bacterium]
MTTEAGLRIFAAGSLRPAFDVLAGDGGSLAYANARDLADRITAGEEADVFASASPEHPRALHAAGLVGEPRAFASNRLVVAVPAASPAGDIGVLATPGARVIIEVEGIPLGDYTRDFLRSAGGAFSEAVFANVVAQEQTVDHVAARLLAGDGDAAVLYATDVAARSGQLRGIELPRRSSVAVTCVACVVAASLRPEAAAAWVGRLTAEDAGEVMRRAGFGPPPPPQIGVIGEDSTVNGGWMPRYESQQAVFSSAMDEGIRIGVAAQALGVSVDTLRRWERDERITFERRGNRRVLAPEELARVLRERGTNPRSSARNRMPGVVIDVKRDGVMAQVDMACGPFRIVSLMSREAADELDLKPGQSATAVVKSTIVVVERS